jgi:hypothetical protein
MSELTRISDASTSINNGTFGIGFHAGALDSMQSGHKLIRTISKKRRRHSFGGACAPAREIGGQVKSLSYRRNQSIRYTTVFT